MPPVSTFATTALAGVLVLAVWSDLRRRRIPNALIIGALLIALALRAAMGSAALLDGLLGAGLGLAVLVPLFALGGLGGGDAKLLIVVGAFLGPKGFVVAILATAIAGGTMSVVEAARRRYLVPVLFNTSMLLKYVLTLGATGQRITRDTPGTIDVPYAIAIAAGGLFALWYGAGP